MKRFNFGTFLVDDANRRAFEVCRDIAELNPIKPQPVLLLGDEGCGKTHLLYSIVNRVRAGSSKTGLAYVTAYDFPDQVRALIDDPSPVERAQNAILLVDQLEAVREWIDELEGVIRIFLDNRHTVVIASSVHHGRLHNLPKSFKDLLDSGSVVQIIPRTSESQLDLIRRQVRTESDSLLAIKQQEVDQLRAILQRTGRSNEIPESFEESNIRFEAERAAKEELARKLADTEQDVASLKEEAEEQANQIEELRGLLDAARREAVRAREDGASELEATRTRMALELEAINAAHRQELQSALREAKEAIETAHELQRQLEESRTDAKSHWQVARDLQQQLGSIQDESHEQSEKVTHLNVQLAEARKEAESSVAEIRRLSTLLEDANKELAGFREERATLADEFAALRAQWEVANRERDEAVRERDQLVGRATTLLQQVEERRIQIAQAEQEHHRRIGEMEKLIEQMTTSAIDPVEMERLETELSETKSALETALKSRDSAVAELEQLRAESGGIRQELETARAELEARQNELNESAEEVERVRAEVERLRGEADQTHAEFVRFREEAANERALLDEDKQRLAARLQDVESERDDLRARLQVKERHYDECETERDTLRVKLQSKERECDERERELESLRQEAAAQVAAANAQAGEVEGRMVRLQNVYDALCRQHHKVADQLAAAADVLTRLGSQLQTQDTEPVEDRQLELTPAFFENLANAVPLVNGPSSHSYVKLDAETGVVEASVSQDSPLENIMSPSSAPMGSLDDYEMYEGEGDHSI
ncbi:MAG: hypothetical protein K1Y02_16095 [Candidatus Hydrogenedentes bacterium]|nr:hypothetical protein [Candidatus Hydrogenedentota bacterium]